MTTESSATALADKLFRLWDAHLERRLDQRDAKIRSETEEIVDERVDERMRRIAPLLQATLDALERDASHER